MRLWILASVIAGALGMFAGDGEVSGRVSDSAQFAACARVDLIDLADPSTVLSARTDSEGRFRFAGVTAGRYSMRVTAWGFSEVRRTAIEVTNAGYHEDFVLQVADCHCEGGIDVADGTFEQPVAGRDLTLVSHISRFKLPSAPQPFLPARFGKRK